MKNKALLATAAATIAMLGTSEAEARYYRRIAIDRPVEAEGGDDRDLISLNLSEKSIPSGKALVTLTPQGNQALTLIVYDVFGNQIVRSSGARGETVSLVVPFDLDYKAGLFSAPQAFVLRVVPTGGAYDHPMGTKIGEKAAASFSNSAMLGAYRVELSDAGSGAAPARPATTATQVASAPAPAKGSGTGSAMGAMVRPAAPARTAPAQPAAASAPTAPAVAAGGIPPKMLAAITPYIGTRWRAGPGSYAIEWDKPGVAFKVVYDGVFLRQETLIGASADGKSWRAVQLNLDTGETRSADLKLKPGRFPMLSEGNPWQCLINRKSGQLDCTVTSGGQSSARSLPAITAAQASALVAAAPARFVAKKPGTFHPVLGAFAEISRTPYNLMFKDTNGVLQDSTVPLILEVGANGANYSLIYQGGSTAFLSGAGPLTGQVADPNPSNPDKQVPYRAFTGANGTTTVCWTQFSNEACHNWRTSPDGAYAVRWSANETTYYKRQASRPAIPASLGVFAKLRGRIFDTGGGATIAFNVGPDYAQIHREGAKGAYTSDTSSYTSYLPKAGTFGGKPVKEAKFALTSTSYSIGTARYTLADKAILYTDASGKQQRWPETTPGLAALTKHDNWARAEYPKAMRDYRQNQREEAQERARNAQMWAKTLYGLGQALGGAPTSNTAMLRPTTPAEWASRLGVSGSSGSASKVGGYSSMGGVSYTPAPMMTPAQRAKWEEIERIKMREQIYAGQKPTTFAEDAMAKTQVQNQQLALQQAEQDRVRKAQEARDAASSQAERDAIERQQADEQRRKDEEAARAEQLRKQKLVAEEEAKKKSLAAEEAARKRREAEEKARQENELVEWKEGIAVCEPASNAPDRYRCFGPLQSIWGNLDLSKSSALVSIGEACGVSANSVRNLGASGSFRLFGCGYGIHPSESMRSVPLHGDPVSRFGISYVPGRMSFRCPRKQTNICRNQ